MFEVHECIEEYPCIKYSEQFCLDYKTGDRAFVLYEDGAKGMGVLGLCGGVVVLKKISDCGNPAYQEALLRTMLFSLSKMQPIQVIKKGIDARLIPFGFTEKNGNMMAMNNQIHLQCHQAHNNTVKRGGENENGY